MSHDNVKISFENGEKCEEHFDKVQEILRNETGTDDHPTLKIFPPVYHELTLNENAIVQLRQLDGVKVQVPGE